MKRVLSFILSLVMIFSCFSVIFAGAENGGISDLIYSEETIAASESALMNFQIKGLPTRIDDFEKFWGSDEWKKVDLFGIGLDFLYSGKGSLVWSELDVFVREDGKLVYGEDGLPKMLISKDDISLAFTNLSIYLERVFYDEYGALNLYTIENAVALANFIGKMFYPDFKELKVDNYKSYFGNKIPSANEFFKAVTSFSGLDTLINYNWVPKGKDFCQPLVNILGGNYLDVYEDYYNDGLMLGSKLIEAMYKKLLTVGPIEFIYDILNIFSSVSYGISYRDAVLALFTHKIASFGSYITTTELEGIDGLLKLIFCDAECFTNNLIYTNKFCPMPFPSERYNSTTNKEDKLIYLYYYLNLCGRYKNNTFFFESLKQTIDAKETLVSDDKMKLKALVDGFFLGRFDVAVKDAIVPLYKENISTATTSLSERMKNAFMTFMKKIADYFEYLRKIISGELQYGQGNSPFN